MHCSWFFFADSCFQITFLMFFHKICSITQLNLNVKQFTDMSDSTLLRQGLFLFLSAFHRIHKLLKSDCKKCCLKISAKFRKTPLSESFFNKVTSLRPVTLLEKETTEQLLSCEFREIYKNTFLQNTPCDCFCKIQIEEEMTTSPTSK